MARAEPITLSQSVTLPSRSLCRKCPHAPGWSERKQAPPARGSCSPSGRRSWIRAESTRCSRSATGYFSGPRSCSMQPTSRPRWDGPYIFTACPSPNAYTLAPPRRSLSRCSPTVNVDRLKPFVTRARPGYRRLPGRSQTLGRRASTRWSCRSTANWCVRAWRAAPPGALAGLHISGRNLAAD